MVPEKFSQKEALYSFNIIDDNEFKSIHFKHETTFYELFIIDHEGLFNGFHECTFIFCCLSSSYVYAYMTIFHDPGNVLAQFYTLLTFYEIFFFTSMALRFITSY